MRFATLVLFLLAMPAPRAHAQDLVPVADREVRLDAWITTWGQSAESSRLWAGGLGVGVGAVLVGAGVWSLADPTPGLEALTPIMWVAAAVDLAVGITALLVPSVPELRLARWRTARRAGPLSAEQLASFEGELTAEAEYAGQQRALSMGLGLGLVAAGAIGLGLTAALGQDELAWAIGYTASGSAVFVGGLLSLLSLMQSPIEQEWDAYRRGFAPPAPSVRLSPVIGPSIVGLSASGSF